jgi:hypothetical protein
VRNDIPKLLQTESELRMEWECDGKTYAYTFGESITLSKDKTQIETAYCTLSWGRPMRANKRD